MAFNVAVKRVKEIGSGANDSGFRSWRAPFRSVGLLAVIVSLTMASWLVAANHCSISGWQFAATNVEETALCCPATDDRLPVPGMQMQCGDELNSPLPPALDAPPVQLLFLKVAWMEIAAIPFDEPLVETQLTSNRAPPGETSFVQLFLTRRLLAHAPPVRVA